jgi:hypothetical protein
MLGARGRTPNSRTPLFMLAGDTGTSNHDSAERHKHWVQTGPHVMIVGLAAPEMLSPYPRDLDIKDPTQPFVMFPGKPYEHLMIPVHSQELTTGSTR